MPFVGSLLTDGKVVVKLDDEVVAEVLWHATAVFHRVAADTTFCRVSLDMCLAVEGVYHDIGLLRFREGEAHDGGTLGGCDLGCHIPVGQIYLIIIRSGRLGFVREPRRTLVLVDGRSAGGGHDGKLSVIVDPWRWLVGLLDAPNLVLGVDILPSVAHAARLGCPEVHAPGQCHGRVGVAGGE